MDTQILQTSAISVPTAFVLIIFILWKSGLLKALSERWGKNGSENRLKELESFKEAVETNHLHDLQELKEKLGSLDRCLNDFKLKVENRLTKIETTLKI